MNKEDYYYINDTELVDTIELDRRKWEILKTNNFYQRELLKNLTDNEIALIVSDKKRELQREKKELLIEIKGTRWDARKYINAFSEDRQNAVIKIIKFLQFQLKLRSPYVKSNYITIDELKSKIDIVSFIERITWLGISDSRRLIKCPLEWHDDKTASFKIYTHTDTFYCQWCRRGWDHITFLQWYYWISKKEAVHKFKEIMK